MKKLMLVLLAAGLFVACGNTKQNEEKVTTDTTTIVADTAQMEEAPVAEVIEPATEVQKPTSTTTTTTTTTTAKTKAPAEVKEEPKVEAQPAAQEKTTPTKKRR